MAASKKILIIDDDRDVHTILKTSLEQSGYTVFAALDAMQGPMAARQVQPDLIILDIMMPAGGGVAVYSRLKQSSGSFNIPILIYSAVPAEQIHEKIPTHPRNQILTKPVPPSEVTAAVGKVLSGE
jgi:DNA-binding response OmpR family regulator